MPIIRAKCSNGQKKYFSSSNEIWKAVPLFDKLWLRPKPSFRCYPMCWIPSLSNAAEIKRHHLVSSRQLTIERYCKTALFPYQQEGVLFATTGRSLHYCRRYKVWAKRFRPLPFGRFWCKRNWVWKKHNHLFYLIEVSMENRNRKIFLDATVTVGKAMLSQRQHLYEKTAIFKNHQLSRGRQWLEVPERNGFWHHHSDEAQH